MMEPGWPAHRFHRLGLYSQCAPRTTHGLRHARNSQPLRYR